MIKILMSWNIVPGLEGDYFDFIIREFEPGLIEMGLRTTDVWYTIYGDLPQIITGSVAADMERMQQALDSTQWKTLQESLSHFIVGYRQKLIPANGGYQL